MIAFVVTAVPAWALTKEIGKNLESLWVIALALFIGGIVMWIVDSVFTRPRVTHMEEMSLPQAIWIGACQILSAVFPGTSRSMSTIAAGQIAGLSRPAALEFSFFLSMPTMAVATLYDLLKTIEPYRHLDVERKSRAARDERATMDRARDRFCHFVHCRPRCGRLVHALGAATWLRAVCDLSDHPRLSW